CFYGIDFADRAELIANGLSTDEICRSIDADSLAFVELDALIGASGVQADNLCRACFDGIYPIDLPDDEDIHLLEGSQSVDRQSGAAAEPAPTQGAPTTVEVNP